MAKYGGDLESSLTLYGSSLFRKHTKKLEAREDMREMVIQPTEQYEKGRNKSIINYFSGRSVRLDR